MLKYTNVTHCASCKCVQPGDPLYNTCVSTCSPKALFQDQIALLKDNNWLDESTRAVIVDSAMVYPGDNLFTTVRNSFEFPPFAGTGTGGGVYANTDVNTFKLFR
jgi:hypothetical protein